MLTVRKLMLLACLPLAFAACGTEEDPPGQADTGGDTSEDTGGDAGGDSGTDAGGCATPDPSMSCMDTGCGEGETCVEVADGCAPSTCSCDEESGGWICTTDCGPEFECVPETTTCPSDAPEPGAACDAGLDGETCGWGEECCCGECYDSFVCSCSEGTWQCYASDACLIESCIGRTCDEDSDCDGGGIPGRCEDGECVDARDGCYALSDAASCDAEAACEWIEPSGCPDPSGPTALPEAGCYPTSQCGFGDSCPAETSCLELSVAPRCYWDDPLCDACDEVRSLCVPTL